LGNFEGSAARYPGPTSLTQGVELFKDCDLEAATTLQEVDAYFLEA
jgi:hypothetical protein